MKLFCGSSNVPLAEDIAKELGISLSASKITRFSNSETKVQILEDVRDEVCVVIQTTSSPTDTHLMELFLFCDALRRQEAKKVIGVIPFFGYARQDMQHFEGESVSAHMVIRFLETVGFSKIYTLDLHNEATSAVFSIPFKNMTAMRELAKATKAHFTKKNISLDEVSLLIPDQGGIEQGRFFGEELYGSTDFPMAVIEKQRTGETVQSFGIHGEIKGKHVVVVDDMIVTGGTIISAVESLKKEYTIETLTVVATHHDFVKDAVQKLEESIIDTVIASNSILLDPNLKMPKLHEVSLAPLIADELRHLIQ
ncbi:MAG: Ribose-phosphate pyrophosphokinase [Microgenomates bacterium OLB23]|nr:MAG: Ribose-phosphate pyrophosphokinase [Microgenomates bacterium OLB23]